jgi:hypothetical protein
MRARLLVAVAAALLIPAAPAVAGDPIMPLSQVHGGMSCKGYSVVRGTEIAEFDVHVVDVVDADPAVGQPRILVEVSGPAVDETGVGPGFSGSPVYCDDGSGTRRNIGAISESIGQYGGKVVLATPIESILGHQPDAPAPKAGAARRRDRAIAARARPLAAPLTISGLSPRLGRALEAAGRRAGRTVIATPAGPLGSFPPQELRPGSAVGVAYSSGDLRLGAVGTVAYTDADRVWAFGHPFEGAGRRALLLQDAYVYRVIDNPVQLGDFGSTYKLASLGHDLGTISNDADSAVVGRVGALPSTVPVRVFAKDLDTGVEHVTGLHVADEAAIDLPEGSSPLTFVTPLAVSQAGTGILGATPGRLTGEMCVQITLRELKKPIRVCNRYVSEAPADPDFSGTSSVVAARAASDAFDALAMLEEYQGPPPHVTEVAARIDIRRGQRQAFLQHVRVPSTIRPGSRIRVRATMRRVRGGLIARTYRMRVPRDLRPGLRRLTFVGTDADTADDSLLGAIVISEDQDDGAGDPGPPTLRRLADAIHSLERFDGVRIRGGGVREPAFRDRDLRIAGRAHVFVRVARRR